MCCNMNNAVLCISAAVRNDGPVSPGKLNVDEPTDEHSIAFSDLTLLVWLLAQHPASKN